MTVPYTFANASGQVPASELDANFVAVTNQWTLIESFTGLNFDTTSPITKTMTHSINYYSSTYSNFLIKNNILGDNNITVMEIPISTIATDEIYWVGTTEYSSGTVQWTNLNTNTISIGLFVYSSIPSGLSGKLYIYAQ
jgi:hypothetical protein